MQELPFPRLVGLNIGAYVALYMLTKLRLSQYL
jgi:hypothetical protein